MAKIKNQRPNLPNPAINEVHDELLPPKKHTKTPTQKKGKAPSALPKVRLLPPACRKASLRGRPKSSDPFGEHGY